MVFQWQVHRYNPPFCERHRRGYETEGCLRIEFKPHKNKRLPAASCTETSWIATIFLKSDRFIQPDSRCVLCYDLQLYLQVSRLLRAFDARKRKSLPDAAPPVGFFNGDAEVRTIASCYLFDGIACLHFATISFTSPPAPGIFYPTEYSVSETDRPGTGHRS